MLCLNKLQAENEGLALLTREQVVLAIVFFYINI